MEQIIIALLGLFVVDFVLIVLLGIGAQMDKKNK